MHHLARLWFYLSPMHCVCTVTASGAEGEAGEAADCPGRPVQSQRGETEGAAETQGGGEGTEEEGGRGGSQVSVRDSSNVARVPFP